MTNGPKFFLFSFAVVFCLQSCANIANLEGGARDTTPPKPDSLRSTQNFQTRFRKQEVALSFNEWIKFDDPSQVVVSPPLEKKPNIQLKGKTIRFTFDEAEELRPNTTYTLNFGESIKDITEGNKSNYRFVFSTGERIDSNTVRFTVLDALKNEPVENILVMMYEQMSDSVVSEEKPLYFGKTGKNGTCSIENVREGKFRVFALQDGNQNFKYDLPTEKTGFLSTPLLVRRDSAAATTIRLFEPDLPVRIKEKRSEEYGQVKLVFSKNATGVKPIIENIGQRSLLEYRQDTLRIWYSQGNENPWKCIVLKDTITVKNTGREGFLTKAKLQPVQSRSVGGRGNEKAAAPETIHPTLPLDWNFNHPIVLTDSSKLLIQDDSSRTTLKNIKCSLNKDLPRMVKINAPWQENHRYTITALPGAFSDLFGLTNDTISRQIQVAQLKKFGEISLKIYGLSDNISYLVELLSLNGTVVAEYNISGATEQNLIIKNLTPAVYEVQITEDLNRNGRRDSGNYYEQRQPEKTTRKKLDELKPNWTLETEIQFQ